MLVHDVAMGLVNGIRNLEHHAVMDNFFCSIELFMEFC